VSPVVESPELVERDVTDEGVALIVEGRGHVAGDAEILRSDIPSGVPGAAFIIGVGGVGIILVNGDDLSWIVWVDGDGWLGEGPGGRRETKHLSA
jgi:hypothetical protein